MTIALTASIANSQVRLTGSGASFPYPIYSTWFKSLSRQVDGLIIDYQAKGSGAGIRDFINGTVDFAGSDAAMTDHEISEVAGGVLMVPMTAGAIVVSYNLPELDKPVRLPRSVYPAIFLAEITRWNDPAIAAANPGVALPNLPITVVRRADSSGTTFAFTNHLAAVSESWSEGPGIGKTVVWPDSDKVIASPKNDGVTATIMQTPGAVGYIEYGYARYASLPMALLENSAGRYIEPSLESGRAALADAAIPDDMRIWIPDPQGEGAYPIVAYSWLLLKKSIDDPTRRKRLVEMIGYCLTEGQRIADRLGYLPLPAQVVQKAQAEVARL